MDTQSNERKFKNVIFFPVNPTPRLLHPYIPPPPRTCNKGHEEGNMGSPERSCMGRKQRKGGWSKEPQCWQKSKKEASLAWLQKCRQAGTWEEAAGLGGKETVMQATSVRHNPKILHTDIPSCLAVFQGFVAEGLYFIFNTLNYLWNHKTKQYSIQRPSTVGVGIVYLLRSPGFLFSCF